MDRHDPSSKDDHHFSSLANEQESFVHLSRDAFIIPGISSVTMANAHLTSRQIEELVLDKYTFIELLGRGASAEVHRVVQRRTGQELAIKVIRRDGRMNDTITMSGEAASLLALKKQQQSSSSQHVAGLVELFVGKDSLFLVTRLAQHGGDMLHLLGHTISSLNAESVYSERDVSLLFRHLLVAMSNIHSAGIVHRDLKFDNILYTMHKESKLDDYHGVELLVADFGLSAPPGHVSAKPRGLLPFSLKSNNKASNDKGYKAYSKRSKRLREVWGTNEYFAPEVLAGQGYGSQADVWALGCLLVEMLTGELAFSTQEQSEAAGDRMLERLSLKERNLRPFELLAGWRQQALSAEAKHLVAGLLYRDPKRRLSVEEALQHPFITNSSNVPLPVAASKLQGRFERREKRRQHAIEQQQLQATAKRIVEQHKKSLTEKVKA